jgi:hypothetical protein
MCARTTKAHERVDPRAASRSSRCGCNDQFQLAVCDGTESIKGPLIGVRDAGWEWNHAEVIDPCCATETYHISQTMVSALRITSIKFYECNRFFCSTELTSSQNLTWSSLQVKQKCDCVVSAL